MPEITSLALSEISGFQRCDAEFFSPSVGELLRKLSKHGCQPLSDFVRSVNRGLPPDYSVAGVVPVIRTANVRELEFSHVRQEYVTEQFYQSASKGQIGANDIVVTSTGVGTLGRVFCNIAGDKCFADGHITILKLRDGVDVCFLAAALQSRVGELQFQRWQRGSSGQIEIYPEDICSILIPKLPVAARQKISTLWRTAVEAVRRSRSLYPQAEQELLDRISWEKIKNGVDDLFFAAKVSEITEHGRADPEHFRPKFSRVRQQLRKLGASTLDELTTEIAKGTQPAVYDDQGPVIVVKSKNVFGQGIDFTGCERTSLIAYEDTAARLSEGDVVMNSTGFGTLGRAAFVPHISDKTVAAVDLLVLRLRKSEALPEYVTLFLNSQPGLWQSEMFQTGSSGQLHLYPQYVRQILVYLPRNTKGEVDIEWQRKLAQKITAASQAKDEARIKLEAAKKLVEDCLKSRE